MYFLVISHLLCIQNAYYVSDKKVSCLGRLGWARFVVDLLDEFCQIMSALIEKCVTMGKKSILIVTAVEGQK